MNFALNAFSKKIICENENSDAKLEAVFRDNEFELFLLANESKPCFIELHWDMVSDENTLVLGDAWERSYGDLGFRRLQDNTRALPWYFLATNKEESFCFGVKTNAASFVSFSYDTKGITAVIDVRNGGSGVHLNSRRLLLATFIYSHYESGNVFDALKDFCNKMCVTRVLPKERIYGGNNWYYAYGNSSYEQIISDAKLQVSLSEGIENRPFQVIDDCWQINSCEGPWLPNEKFRDMKKLADEIRALGARPGIWVRLLHNRDSALTEEMRIHRNGEAKYLDPTHPEVKKYIISDIQRIKSWGYELMKHDFTTYDLFGAWGSQLSFSITNIDSWHFYDKTKTNAEIVTELYKLIYDTANKMYIIGCNTISHLSAGLVHLSRTGDDTSGRKWERTRKMGVNTLAFRLPHNEVFYMCDADCVGILEKNIPWEKNKQWLHLLSYSNTPLFISCTDSIDDEQKADIKEAYRVFNESHSIRPLDILDTLTPEEWEIDGRIIKYTW